MCVRKCVSVCVQDWDVASRGHESWKGSGGVSVGGRGGVGGGGGVGGFRWRGHRAGRGCCCSYWLC